MTGPAEPCLCSPYNTSVSEVENNNANTEWLRSMYSAIFKHTTCVLSSAPYNTYGLFVAMIPHILFLVYFTALLFPTYSIYSLFTVPIVPHIISMAYSLWLLFPINGIYGLLSVALFSYRGCGWIELTHVPYNHIAQPLSCGC